MIELRNITHWYDDPARPALRNVSLRVAAGELVALVGGSGSGKTTLLKTINRLVEPRQGEVRINGRDNRSMPAHLLRRTIGHVVQTSGLFPHWTVFDNVAAVPRLLGWSADRVRQRVNELMTMIRLPAQDYAQRFPDSLSGGQRQRVGFARALAGSPSILLMDEPFGALDPEIRDELRAEFLQVHRSLGLTTVLVTHDLVEALELADRIAVLDQGELIRLATPRELVSRPSHPAVERMLNGPVRHARLLAGWADPSAQSAVPISSNLPGDLDGESTQAILKSDAVSSCAAFSTDEAK
jgi:osmoprotectant transport system ATP-binding protein